MYISIHQRTMSGGTARRVTWQATHNDGNMELNDPRYVRMDDDTLKRALGLFDNDSNIKTVFQITMNSILSGNIVFRHGGESNRFQESTEDQRWLSHTYGDLCRDIVRHLWSVGFAPVTYVKHPTYVAKPVVLNLERCETYYYKDIFGEPHFRFFERLEFPNTSRYGSDSVSNLFLGTGGGLGLKVDVNRREIPNVTVFVSDAPTTDGELRSRIMLLAPDLLFEAHLYSCCWEADRHRCNPPVISQKMSKVPDSKNLSITDRLDTNRIRSVYDGDGNQEGEVRAAQIHQLQADRDHMDHVAAFMQQGMESTNLDPSGIIKRRKILHNHSIHEMHLDTDRQYARHVLPESPHDMLINFRNARMERVLALFSVPMSMISQQSSLGGRTSMTENSYIIFLDAQKQLKQLLISYIYEVYRNIYDVMNAYDYVVDTLKNKQTAPSSKGLYDSMHCEVTMPGLPPEVTVERLFLLGLLKHEAFVNFLHDKHAIPVEDFNTDPKLTLQEMNQLPPPEEQGSGREAAASSSNSK